MTEIKKDKKYLSWSSSYEQLDDNRKWAVWQKNIPEITVQFKN